MTGKSPNGKAPALKTAISFHDEIAGSWSDGYCHGSFKRRLDALKPALSRQVTPGSEWMDMGCGSGVLVGELRALGARVVGVDGAPAMIEHARWARADDTLVRFIVSNVTQISACADGAFDGILCSSVLEYIDAPMQLLQEAARLLREEGRLIITVPRAYSAVRTAQHAARLGGRVAGKDVFSYLNHSRFTQSAAGMTAMLAQAGFSVERIGTFDPYMPPALHRLLPPAMLIIEARRAV